MDSIWDDQDLDLSEDEGVAEDALKGSRGTTNLTKAYVVGWEVRHGWREYYQNWYVDLLS